MSLCGFSQAKKDSVSKIKVQKERVVIAEDEDLFRYKQVVMTVPELMPEYPGGYPAMFRQIEEDTNIKGDQCTGTVYASFTIDEKGDVRDIKILRGLSPDSDQKVVDALSKLKRFAPAIQNGKALSYPLNLPVKFK